MLSTTDVTTPAARLEDEFALSMLGQVPTMAKQTRNPPLINMAVGQPNFPVQPHIVAAAAKAAIDIPFGYAPAEGGSEVRSAISKYLFNCYQVPVNSDRIIATVGGKEGIFVAISGLINPGDEILLPAPGFPSYRSVARLAQAQITEIPIPDGQLVLTAGDFLDRIRSTTRMLVINSPGNPTGGVMAPAEIAKLVEGLRNYPNCLVLSDEVYGRIVFPSHQFTSLLHFTELHSRLLVVDSLSKSHAMSGWRFGWLVGSPNLIPELRRYVINIRSNLPGIIERAAIAALTGDQSFLAEQVAAYHRRANQFVSALAAFPGLACPIPHGAFYAYLDARKVNPDDQALAEQLWRQAGIVAIPASGFSSYASGRLRFSLAVNDDALTTALARLTNFFATATATV